MTFSSRNYEISGTIFSQRKSFWQGLFYLSQSFSVFFYQRVFLLSRITKRFFSFLLFSVNCVCRKDNWIMWFFFSPKNLSWSRVGSEFPDCLQIIFFFANLRYDIHRIIKKALQKRSLWRSKSLKISFNN